jgi:putative ABC transport system permease protein
MVPVARRNLFAEKGRFAISVGGVALAVLLILTVLALYRGWSRAGEVFEQLPGQIWVVQRGTSDPFHSVSLIDNEQLSNATDVQGVLATVPVLSRQMNFQAGGSEQDVRLMALDATALGPTSPDLEERFLAAEGSIIIESTLSRKTGLGQGDEVEIGGVTLTVARVRPRGGDVLSQFAFVHFSDAKRIFGVGDVVNYGMVVLADDANVGVTEAVIEARDPGIEAFTAEAFAESVRKEIDEAFLPVIAILLAIGFIVGTAVVGLTIYTATIERTREFGVMKAVGAGAGFLYRIVLAQATILTGAGFVAGLAGSMVVADLAARAVPEFATDFQVRDVIAVLAAVIVMAFAASVMPVRRVNSIDPAIVFRA